MWCIPLVAWESVVEAGGITETLLQQVMRRDGIKRRMSRY